MDYQIIQGDCREILKTLPDQSVQCCVTSPPYYGLRDYQTGTWQGGDKNCNHVKPSRIGNHCTTGHTQIVGIDFYRDECELCGAVRIDNQIGLEETPESYVENMVAVFREVWRVLKDDGTLWLNLGDSYANDTKWGGKTGGKHATNLHGTNIGRNRRTTGLKSKDMIGIPWRVAFALQADGWYLRQDVIWHKPNPMPESVTDRCTKAHEYIFLLSKNAQYFYNHDAIKEPAVDAESYKGRKFRGRRAIYESGCIPTNPQTIHAGNEADGKTYERRNRRDVWTVQLRPFRDAHFATFPPELITPCILAGSKPGDTVLDPFNGAGTTGLVSLQAGRRYIGIELNADYIEITHKRLQPATTLLIPLFC